MRSFLFPKGYEIDVAYSGKEALGYIQDPIKMNSVLLIILDRILGDMDGIDLIPKCGNAKIIILSVFSSEQDILKGLKKGAAEYLTKPFNMNILYEKIKKLIG